MAGYQCAIRGVAKVAPLRLIRFLPTRNAAGGQLCAPLCRYLLGSRLEWRQGRSFRGAVSSLHAIEAARANDLACYICDSMTVTPTVRTCPELHDHDISDAMLLPDK